MHLLAIFRALLIPKAQLVVENIALRQQIATLARFVNWAGDGSRAAGSRPRPRVPPPVVSSRPECPVTMLARMR
jgi:hypothetical protein